MNKVAMRELRAGFWYVRVAAVPRVTGGRFRQNIGCQRVRFLAGQPPAANVPATSRQRGITRCGQAIVIFRRRWQRPACAWLKRSCNLRPRGCGAVARPRVRIGNEHEPAVADRLPHVGERPVHIGVNGGNTSLGRCREGASSTGYGNSSSRIARMGTEVNVAFAFAGLDELVMALPASRTLSG
jgi:hypothetical protein